MHQKMADTTSTDPLLLQHHQKQNKHSTVDDRIEQCIGHFGWAQLIQSFLVSFAWAFDAQQTFISIFTDAEPSWHCTANCGATAVSNICELPSNATWGWDSPKGSTIISEWGLQCSSSFVKGLPASSFFMGCLIGGLVLATLADSWLGRKNLLVISCLSMALSGILTAVFSTSIWVYSLLRFVCGFARAAIGTCSLVLATEVVGKRWRGQVGVMGFVCFALGFLSLPGIAYITRGASWRAMYIWTSIPALIYCALVNFFVKESPRWLLVRGRKEEAIDTLKTIATLNRSSLTLSFFGEEEEAPPGDDMDVYSAMRILVSKPWALRRLFGVAIISSCIGLVYYGMPLALGNLPFNLYLSVTLNALSELPASFVTFILIDKMNRKSSLIGFTLLSGVCSVMVVVVGYLYNGDLMMSMQIGLEIMSFLGACSSLNIMLIYAIELFPTCVRNSAVSVARQALVFGGVFSPPLVAAGRTNPFLTYGVFGLLIGACGLFVGGLPETKGVALSNTMDEEEEKENGSILC